MSSDVRRRSKRHSRFARTGSIWSREEPSSRRPGLTRDDIAEAALRIADSEGFDAVSMRRVARELGAGTMTLYHYVETKDELIALMGDRIMGEVVIEGKLPKDWRKAITKIAQNSRDAFLRHPWAINRMTNTQGGPNSLRHFDQSLEAVADTGLSVDERLQLVLMVDDFVFGWTMREVATTEARPAEDEIPEGALEFFSASLGNYPHIAELIGDDDIETGVRRLADTALAADRFDRGLELLLDGVEASLD